MRVDVGDIAEVLDLVMIVAEGGEEVVIERNGLPVLRVTGVDGHVARSTADGDARPHRRLAPVRRTTSRRSVLEVLGEDRSPR